MAAVRVKMPEFQKTVMAPTRQAGVENRAMKALVIQFVDSGSGGSFGGGDEVAGLTLTTGTTAGPEPDFPGRVA
jgi:hypothetical protein